MGQALVRRIRNRVPCVCINPAEGGGTDLRGNWTINHASVRKVNRFGRVIWISGRNTPVHVPLITSTIGNGSERKNELQTIRAHIRPSAM